jgi:hypothetical protein
VGRRAARGDSCLDSWGFLFGRWGWFEKTNPSVTDLSIFADWQAPEGRPGVGKGNQRLHFVLEMKSGLLPMKGGRVSWNTITRLAGGSPAQVGLILLISLIEL